MPLRRKTRQELNHVALLVISLLGIVAITATAWSGWLIHEALVYESPNPNGTIDAAVVALIGQMVSIATLTIGGLTAMLTSTGPKPAPPPTVTSPEGVTSTPVTVVNPPADPVPTEPQPPAEPEPEPEAIDELEPDPEPEPDAAAPRPRKRAEPRKGV